MSNTIKIVFNRLPEIAAKLPREASDAVRKAAFDVEAHAKGDGRVPVDTGTLKNSIYTNIEPMALEAEVIAGDGSTTYGKRRKDGSISSSTTPSAEYAPYVEFGTRHMGAQPFMTPAAEVVRPQFERAMGQLVDRL